jgi:hypothetical protein
VSLPSTLSRLLEMVSVAAGQAGPQNA